MLHEQREDTHMQIEHHFSEYHHQRYLQGKYHPYAFGHPWYDGPLDEEGNSNQPRKDDYYRKDGVLYRKPSPDNRDLEITVTSNQPRKSSAERKSI